MTAPDPLATVLIRTRDEAASIGRLLGILATQTIAQRLEIVLVDSGSTDDTVAIARASGDVHVIEMPATEFTFGRSLNLGCGAARSPIVIALSAHAFPLDDGWAEHMVRTFDDDERVACACGALCDADGNPIDGPWVQDLEAARRNPTFGYSNAAGGFRLDLWREHPFREDMPGTEDKEWAWHWLNRGMLVVHDPELEVDHDHSHDPLASVYERARREWVGYGMYLDLPAYSARTLVREWWSELDGHATHARARLSPWRGGRMLGKYAGLRAVRREHR
jgi:rhamnosyltransferase